MKSNRITIYLLTAIATILPTGCGHSHEEHHEKEGEHHHADEILLDEHQMEEGGVVVETVTPGDFRNVVKVGGKIISPTGDEQTIAATASGIVNYVNTSITEGTAVGAGQTLVTISAKKLQDGDPAIKAKIEYEAAKREYDRANELVKDKIISVKEFEQIKMQYETAKMIYEAQTGHLTAGGVAVSTPMGGYIKSLIVAQGAYVSVGDPIAIVSQNRRLQLRAEVPEKDYKYLKNVGSANFRPSYEDKVYKLSELNGRIVSYGKTTGEESYYLPMTFEFDNIGEFVAGSYVEVYLLTQPRPGVISLPKSAIVEDQGLYHVYVQVKGEKGAFMKREVTLGQDNGERVEIVSGLKAGEQVVAQGAYQVKLAGASGAIPEGHNHQH